MKLLTFSLFALSITAHAELAPTYETQEYDQPLVTGYVQTPEGEEFQRSAQRDSFASARVPIPARYSMRGKTGAIESQGQCGSCWDFSLTSTLRGTWAMSGKDPGRLSFNYLLNCAANAYGCWGGNLAASEYLLNPQGPPKYGVDGEYTGRRGSCERNSAAASAARAHMLGQRGSSPSFKDIAYVLGVLHRPVAITVYADSRWKAYKSGIFNGCSPQGGMNHLVVIEGYDCEGSVNQQGACVFDKDGNLPAGKGLWIIRNSWGDKWGDKGWITTKATDPSGFRCNNVAADALYFELK